VKSCLVKKKKNLGSRAEKNWLLVGEKQAMKKKAFLRSTEEEGRVIERGISQAKNIARSGGEEKPRLAAEFFSLQRRGGKVEESQIVRRTMRSTN